MLGIVALGIVLVAANQLLLSVSHVLLNLQDFFLQSSPSPGPPLAAAAPECQTPSILSKTRGRQENRYSMLVSRDLDKNMYGNCKFRVG